MSMRAYDPRLPLISLHIPKCAGQSFRQVLEHFFPGRVYFHYFQMKQSLPPRYELSGGMCIHGHFNLFRGFGVPDYYPGVQQFITLLRDPLETAISNYFYWKTKARASQLTLGKIQVGDAHDYGDIEAFFRMRPRSSMLDFMPCPLTRENYQRVLADQFVWIGLVESLQAHVDVLANVFQLPTLPVARINVSPRDEELSPASQRRFMADNALEYEIYQHVRDIHRQQGNQ